MKLKYIVAPLLVTVGMFAGCKKPAQPEETQKPAAENKQPAAQPAPQSAADAAKPVVKEEVVSVSIQPEPAKEAPLPDPVAIVNGQPLSRAEFEKTLNEIFSSMGMQPSMLPPDQRGALYRQFAEDMIVDKLIDQASASTQVSPAEVDEELAKITQQFGSQDRFAEELKASGQNMDDFKQRLTKLIRQRKWMESQVKADAVSDAQVTAFYNENKQEFEQPETVRASHILIRVEENADPATVEAKQKQASDLAARAKGGEDFGKLATEFSEDPTAKQNAGDLNYFPKDRMVPQFAEQAFGQAAGTISDPVRTQFGWHVIKVTDKKPAQVMPLAEVKGEIAEYLKETKQQEGVEAVIQGLRAKAKVEILIPEPQPPTLDVQVQGVDVVAPPQK